MAQGRTEHAGANASNVFINKSCGPDCQRWDYAIFYAELSLCNSAYKPRYPFVGMLVYSCARRLTLLQTS